VKIAEIYSHLNGEEFLIVHHKNIYREIKDIILSVKAENFKTKISKEKTMRGKRLYNPDALNREFKRLFKARLWNERRYSYYVTTDYSIMQELMPLSPEEQKKRLLGKGIREPIRSYKQTDFIKENIAIEIQFGKYAFVAYDLFVKHLLFYSGGVINVGIEVLPMKSMQSEMSSGIAYFEGEVYNVLRHGRSNPPVPLVILGITP
jgi:hypothetical protein